MGLTYVFISHDLSVVEHISDQICRGHVPGQAWWNSAATDGNLSSNPMHPYTEALFSAVPVPDPGRSR